MTVEDPLNLILALATICAAKFIAAALLRKKKVASFEYVGQSSRYGYCWDELWAESVELDQPVSWYRSIYIVVSTTEMEKRNICDMNTKPWVNSPNTDDTVTFSEVGICNIASESSLQDLNSRLASPVVMGNFRPTIVVKGCVPFEEDTWREIKIGSSVYMRILEPNPRCLLITVDPNGRRDPGIEPLKTLRKFRKSPLYGDSPLFGVTTAVDHGGVIYVGDPVYLLRKE